MRTPQILLSLALLLAIALTAGCTGTAEEEQPDLTIGENLVPILAEPADIPDKGVAVVISGDRTFSASLSSSQEKREINGCNETLVIPLRHRYTGDVTITAGSLTGSLYTALYLDGRRVGCTASSYGSLSYSTYVGGASTEK